MAKDVAINQDNIVYAPNLHDGYLDGFMMTPTRELVLMCRTASQHALRLRISSVEHLRVDNFREGNIIRTICVRPVATIPERLLEALLGDGALVMHNDYVSNIASKGWSVVHLETSYGCELIALSSATSGVLTLEEDVR